MKELVESYLKTNKWYKELQIKRALIGRSPLVFSLKADEGSEFSFHKEGYFYALRKMPQTLELQKHKSNILPGANFASGAFTSP